MHAGFSPDHTWFAATFMAAAALTVLNSLLTFLGGRLKRKPLMQVGRYTHTCVLTFFWGVCVLANVSMCVPPGPVSVHATHAYV